MGGAYYNEIDPWAAAWLRVLIRRGLIADGEVDERSITDVQAADLSGFTQCHFFAGIGGWSYALRLAGWPDHKPVWTGSPPCQPFSLAGKHLGVNDVRHLSPHFVGLVRTCRPGMLFGEQVASAEVFGKAASGARDRAKDAPAWSWLDDLCDGLESAHYAVGASDLPAACVGAPHQRQRTFFGAIRLADPERPGLPGWGGPEREDFRACGQNGSRSLSADRDIPDVFWDASDWGVDLKGEWRPVEPGTQPLGDGISARVGRLRGYGNAIVPQVGAVFVEAFCRAVGMQEF